MQQVIPYHSSTEAMEALDNGGRFYNILTDANDGEITAAELAKVAGVIGDYQQMSLFLELALSGLSESEIQSVHQSISSDLLAKYKQYQPKVYTPQQATNNGKQGEAAIIQGVPNHIDAESQFTGFIMVPILANNVTTFAMIPIFDQYDVYEVRSESSSESFIIAHARTAEKLPRVSMSFAGMLKEIQKDIESKQVKQLYLDCCYFIGK